MQKHEKDCVNSRVTIAWIIDAMCLSNVYLSAPKCMFASFSLHVDYCNVVLAGLPQSELNRVQSVVNAATCLSADARKYDHVTPLQMDLHWLRVPERVKFKQSSCACSCTVALLERRRDI